MNHLSLLDVPVVFICPDHTEKYSERKVYMFDFLKKLGFKNVSMYKSGTDAYPRCLAEATYHAIAAHCHDDEPFILLEDDVELCEWVERLDVLDVPADADGFYLGYGKYAGHPTENWALGYDSYKLEVLNHTHVRVWNMLGAHAIMFITKGFKKAVMDVMKKIVYESNGYFPDVAVSRLQPIFNIYAYKYPFFYQSDKLGNDPFYPKDATNFRLL